MYQLIQTLQKKPTREAAGGGCNGQEWVGPQTSLPRGQKLILHVTVGNGEDF